MGAQQVKLYQEQLIEQIDENQNLPLNELILQQANVLTKTLKHNETTSSVSSPSQAITVADFAKIKRESPCTVDEISDDMLSKKIKTEYLNKADGSEEVASTKDTSAAVIKQNCDELGFISLSSIEPKKELLAAHAAECGNVVIQNEDILSKVDDDIQIIENSEADQEDMISINKLIKAEKQDLWVTNFKPSSTKLVKNPLAFLKKSCDKNHDQLRSLTATIKSEPSVVNGEELESTNITKETELQTTSMNELVIKSENPLLCEANKEPLENSQLYQTCLSHSLNSSLDVNLSYVDTDPDEVAFKHLPEGVLTNISLNTTPLSIKYFSTFEISSEEENVKVPLECSRSKKIIKNRPKRKAYKKNVDKDYKMGRKYNFQNKSVKLGGKLGKRENRPKTRKCPNKKYYAKDSGLKINDTKQNRSKTLTKPVSRTRKNTKPAIAKRSVHASKVEFPKPFKLETEKLLKGDKDPVVLPKPMMIKNEFVTSSKNKNSFLKPEFQPFVRLKRLKSENLLIPLRTKCGRTRNFKSTSATKQEFRIQQAYSLNPIAKYNRLSMDDYDPSFCHEQRLSGSRYATSCGLLPDVQNEAVDEMESNYFSTQERYTFFHSSTPDASSMFSGRIDSGVSTATPNTSECNLNNYNKSLLLQIAAERAFINNHLMQFGHSPIQFDLYNNLNELKIFLKFLFGNLHKM